MTQNPSMSPLQPQGLRGAVRLLGRPAMRGGPSHRKGLHARRVNCVGGSHADGAVSDLAGQVSEARQCRRINEPVAWARRFVAVRKLSMTCIGRCIIVTALLSGLHAQEISDCVDDAIGLLVGSSCDAISLSMGCETDLNTVDPAVPVGTVLSSICPESCGACSTNATTTPPTCVDDAGGGLALAGMDCTSVVSMGCDVDLNMVNPAAPVGTIVSGICHVSCDACPSAEEPAPSSAPVACVDDPNGDLAAFGGCVSVVSMGCDVDLNTVNPAAPVGSLVSLICPTSCVEACAQAPAPSCADDAAGMLAAAALTCASIVGMSCDTDLSTVNPAAPVGTLVSSICPESCDMCGPPPAAACVDDALGMLTSAGMTCDSIIAMGDMGCATDLNTIHPDVAIRGRIRIGRDP
jgi:hypothetical protein